jgi:hypothetical protein
MMKNRMTNGVIVVVCALAVLVSCDSDPMSDTLSKKEMSSEYLPLEEGNFWDFKAVKGSTNEVVQHREVKGTALINGREYYLIISSAQAGQPWLDSAYYRVESNGNVYVYRRSAASEELKYKLFAGDGDTWSFEVNNDDQMDVTVHVGAVTTGATTIDDCKAYYFDVKEWADEENTVTLAPGVGFVREYSDAWGMGIILTKASIGGNVVEY